MTASAARPPRPVLAWGRGLVAALLAACAGSGGAAGDAAARGPEAGIDERLVAAVAAAEAQGAGQVGSAQARPAREVPGVPAELAEGNGRGPSPGVWIGEQRHPSLAQALSGLPAGARLELEAGRHAGPVELSGTVTLVPREPGTEVVLESSTPVVLRVRTGAQVLVEGLTLASSGARRTGGEAAVTVADGRLELRGCRVQAQRAGAIHVLGGELLVKDGEIRAETWQTCVLLGQGARGRLVGCRVEGLGDPGSAVEAWAAQVTLVRVEASAKGAAVVVGPGGQVEGSECRFSGRTPAWVSGQGELVLFDTELRGGMVGLRCQGQAALERCVLVRNETALLVEGREARLRLVACVHIGNKQRLTLQDADASQVEVVEVTPPGSPGADGEDLRRACAPAAR